MRKNLPIFLAILAATALVSLPVAASAGDGLQTPNLDSVKKLIGTWVMVGEDGKPTEQVVSVYRSTAGGSAVIETLFPGTETEMLTLYTQKGDELHLTHYCMLGNQPHMKAVPSEEGTMHFVCTGLEDEDQNHMHSGKLRWQNKDRIDVKWIAKENGKVDHEADFPLARIHPAGK